MSSKKLEIGVDCDKGSIWVKELGSLSTRFFDVVTAITPDYIELAESSSNQQVRVYSNLIFPVQSDFQSFYQNLASELITCRANAGTGEDIETDGNNFIACDVNDPDIRFLVESVYDEQANSFVYRKTDGAVVVEGVDFVVCESASGLSDIRIRPTRDCLDDDSVVDFYTVYCVDKKADGTLQVIDIGTYCDEHLQKEYKVQGDVKEGHSQTTKEILFITLDTSDPNKDNSYTPKGSVYAVSLFIEGPTNSDGTFNYSSGAIFRDLTSGQIADEQIPNGHFAGWGQNHELIIDGTKKIIAGTGKIIITGIRIN